VTTLRSEEPVNAGSPLGRSSRNGASRSAKAGVIFSEVLCQEEPSSCRPPGQRHGEHGSEGRSHGRLAAAGSSLEAPAP
jgi:hypothetical protein